MYDLHGYRVVVVDNVGVGSCCPYSVLPFDWSGNRSSRPCSQPRPEVVGHLAFESDGVILHEWSVGCRRTRRRRIWNHSPSETSCRPGGRRDDIPPADGSSIRGGSTPVRGRVRGPHISGGQPAAGSQCAYSLGWERQTDRRIAVSLNTPDGGRHRRRLALRSTWCHCHSRSLASVKSRLVLSFWYRHIRVVPEKGPLNWWVLLSCCQPGELAQPLSVRLRDFCSCFPLKRSRNKLPVDRKVHENRWAAWAPPLTQPRELT